VPQGSGADPTVAAVVVTHNRRRYLEELVPSLLAQTRPLDAVYVVDNASTDSTPAYLAEAWAEHPVVRTVRLEHNSGGSGGFHAGVVRAFRDGHAWFWLMDDDVVALPDGLEGLLRWADQAGVIHGRRIDFHGGPFSWQPRINEWLGVPLPYLGDPFADGRTVFRTNSGVFEGMLVSREVVAEIGPPDPRFFLTTDDAVYALMASRVAPVVYVDHFSLRRKRAQRQVTLKVRHLNDASDVSRFHIMRNRGYMAHYLRHLGSYSPVGFTVGTLLVFAKEVFRLVYVEHTLKGVGPLVRGWRESRSIRRADWQPVGTSSLRGSGPAG
jgi:rhamnopyranosyl-N-acetylglucosaminyl-diphospho-decaprenol beta-1,3/1,4-galactofuranosyltransferase